MGANMEDGNQELDMDPDRIEEIRSPSKSSGCSRRNSIDMYEDVLFHSPLEEKMEKSMHFKKPCQPPPEEESVDLYSEFMDKKSPLNNRDPSLERTDQTTLCTGDVVVDGSGLQAQSGGDGSSAVGDVSAAGDVNLDLFTEVLTDELQQRHDSNVELAKKYAHAEARNRQLESEIKIMKVEQEKLRAENITIKRNMSSLLLTAKTELKRKDDEIRRLNSLLTKRNINNFWTKRNDPRKGKEMSPGRQKIADIWNSAKKCSAREYQAGDSTPSKRNKDSDSDSVKRKRTEPIDQGTPKRQKVSPSRNRGTPDSKNQQKYNKSTVSTLQKTESQRSDKELTGRNSRHSSQRKSDEKGNKENRSDKSRGRDRNTSDKRSSESSERTVPKDKKTSGDSRKESGNSNTENKKGDVEKAPTGVKDLREILRKKREEKSAVPSVKSISSSDRKRHASDSKSSTCEEKFKKEVVRETEKLCSSSGKKCVISKVINPDKSESVTELTGHTEVSKCETSKGGTSNCVRSEILTAISDSTNASAPEATVSVLDTKTSKEGSNCYKDSKDKAIENSPKKCILEDIKTFTGCVDQLSQSPSQQNGVSIEVSEDVPNMSPQPDKLHGTSLPTGKKEKRRIKPIMISGTKRTETKKDGQSCFDLVINNIEMRESFDFAQATVVHIDHVSVGKPVTFKSDVVLSLEGKSSESKNYEDNSETISKITRSSSTSIKETVIDKESRTAEAVIDCNITNRQTAHFSMEENEHILVCTKNPDQDNSLTSVSNEGKVESAASECSLDLITEDETCSRTTPYKSSWSDRTTDHKKSVRFMENNDGNRAAERKNKSKKKKKHRNKHSRDSVDCLEDITDLSMAETDDSHTSESISQVCSGEKAHSCSISTSVHHHNASRSVVLSESSKNNPEEIAADVGYKDVNVDMVKNSDVNGNTEQEHGVLAKVKYGKKIEADSQGCLPAHDTPTSVVQASGEASSTHASTCNTEVAPNVSVVNSQVTPSQIQCVDSRLNGHERPPYHVEPFEFSAFPEFYAKSESEDEDRLHIAEQSESEKESMNRDSSFEMDTSDPANETVICVTDENTTICKDKEICRKDENDTAVIETSSKPKFPITLQENWGDGIEDSSGFCPKEVSVENSASREVCVEGSSVIGYSQVPQKYNDVQEVEGDVAEMDQVPSEDKDNQDNKNNSLKHGPDSDKTVINSEKSESSKTFKHETHRQSENDGVETVVGKLSVLSKQQVKTFNRQTSLPASTRGIVENMSTQLVRTRSCSEPQSNSVHKMESQSYSSYHLFDLGRVKPCSSPIAPVSCRPIDLSVKSAENIQHSPSLVPHLSTTDYLHGFNLSKDGALDLSKKATPCSPEATTPCKQDRTCVSDISETAPSKPDNTCNNDSRSWTFKIGQIKSADEHLQNLEHSNDHNTIPSAHPNSDNTSAQGHSPQKRLKPCRSASDNSIAKNMEEGLVRSIGAAIVENMQVAQFADTRDSDSVVLNIEATVVMEHPSSSDEDDDVDICVKSANTSIQSLDISNTSGDGQPDKNSTTPSPRKEVHNESISSSDSESGEDHSSQSEICTSKSVSSTSQSETCTSKSVSSTSQSETCTSKSVSSTQISAVSSNVSNSQVSSGTSITSVQSSRDKMSFVSSEAARSGNDSSSDSSSSSDDDGDSVCSDGGRRNDSSDHEGLDVCVTDEDIDCEHSQSEVLAKTLSSESLQCRDFDIVKLDLQISDDSSISCRESRENLLPSKSTSNVSNDGETMFKLPDMSTSAFAKLASTSHSDVTKSQSSSSVKQKSSEVPRKRLSFPTEENSVLSILADSCDGFDCELDDHKEDCRKFERDSAAEPDEPVMAEDYMAADSEDEEGCIEDGELCDDDTSPRRSISKPVNSEEETQELLELLKAKKLLEEKIHGISCGKGGKEPLASKSADRENRHRSQTHSSSRNDRNYARSSRDSREKDSHRSGHDHDRFSKEIYGSDPRLSLRSSSRYRRDKDDPRHKHYSPSSHRSHVDDRRDRHRDISPISHRSSSYKDQSKENHRREGGDRRDRYAVDGRHRNRSRDNPDSDRSRNNRNSVSHHSARRKGRDSRS